MTARFLEWFSIERTIGLISLLTAGLLFLRPFAAALEVFEDAGLVTITISLERAALLIAALFLIWKGEVGRVVFAFCLLPMIIYALALSALFGFSVTVGPFGFIFGLWACGLTLYVHNVIVGQRIALQKLDEPKA